MRALATCGLLPVPSPSGQEGRLLGDASRTLDEFTCGHVVLDAAMTPTLLAAWAPMLAEGSPRAIAVHAPSPAPEPRRSDARYDPRDVRLAAPERVERDEALALIRPALLTATLTGAAAIVIEGGPLPIASALMPLGALAGDEALGSPIGRETLAEVRRQRAQSGAAAVDGLCFAVEALLPAVEERGLTLMLAEQRGLAWAGSLEELSAVLTRFAGAPVGWWADPLGRGAGDRVLAEDADVDRPTLAPDALIWRLPPDEGDLLLEAPWERIVDPADEGTASVERRHVLAPDGGRVLSWHRHAWQAFAS